MGTCWRAHAGWVRRTSTTFKEAAAVLGIKESAANLRYVRALRRLKELWQKLYEASGAASE